MGQKKYVQFCHCEIFINSAESKKIKGKSTSAIHVFQNQQQQKISDKAWGCGFTTLKKIFCGEQLELKLSLMGGHKNCCQKQS